MMLQRVRCWWRGHDLQLHVESGVLNLRCVVCAYQSPGWACGQHVLRFEAPSRRARAKRVVTARYAMSETWLAKSDRVQ